MSAQAFSVKYRKQGRELDAWSKRVAAEAAAIRVELDFDSELFDPESAKEQAKKGLGTAERALIVLAAAVQATGVTVPDAAQATYDSARSAYTEATEALQSLEDETETSTWEQAAKRVREQTGATVEHSGVSESEASFFIVAPVQFTDQHPPRSYTFNVLFEGSSRITIMTDTGRTVTMDSGSDDSRLDNIVDYFVRVIEAGRSAE